MKKILFVFNPHSGKGQIKNRLLDIVSIFSAADMEVTVYPTKAPLDGKKYIMENGSRYDIIACSGGDGTLNETVGAVMWLNERYNRNIPIGYIPSGTTNDFARSLGIPRDMCDAAKAIVGEKLFRCDIGITEGDRNFNYVAAFGMFTEVSYATPQELKNMLGHQAYILEGVRSLRDLKVQYLRIKANDADSEDGVRCLEGNFIYGMVSNTNSVGGMKGITGKNVDLSDGLFEVTLVREIIGEISTPVDIQRVAQNIFFKDGILGVFVESFKTNHIEFESPLDVAWTFDGEYGGDYKNIAFDVKPGAVDFIVK